MMFVCTFHDSNPIIVILNNIDFSYVRKKENNTFAAALKDGVFSLRGCRMNK